MCVGREWTQEKWVVSALEGERDTTHLFVGRWFRTADA